MYIAQLHLFNSRIDIDKCDSHMMKMIFYDIIKAVETTRIKYLK